MSLVKILKVELDPLHNKDDREYLQLVYSVNRGMNIFSPMLYFLTPGCGNWLPLINSTMIDARVPQRIYQIFKYPPKLVDKQ